MTVKQLKKEIVERNPNATFITEVDDALCGMQLVNGTMKAVYDFNLMANCVAIENGISLEDAAKKAVDLRDSYEVNPDQNSPVIVCLMRRSWGTICADLLQGFDLLDKCIHEPWFGRLSLNRQRSFLDAKVKILEAINADSEPEYECPKLQICQE